MSALFCLFLCLKSYPEKLEEYIPTFHEIRYILEWLYLAVKWIISRLMMCIDRLNGGLGSSQLADNLVHIWDWPGPVSHYIFCYWTEIKSKCITVQTKAPSFDLTLVCRRICDFPRTFVLITTKITARAGVQTHGLLTWKLSFYPLLLVRLIFIGQKSNQNVSLCELRLQAST